MGDDLFTLPDGRKPIRFNRGRSAWYKKKRGEGEVMYRLSHIKYLKKLPRLSEEELKEVARKRVETIKAKDPNHYRKAGSKGGYSASKNRQEAMED